MGFKVGQKVKVIQGVPDRLQLNSVHTIKKVEGEGDYAYIHLSDKGYGAWYALRFELYEDLMEKWAPITFGGYKVDLWKVDGDYIYGRCSIKNSTWVTCKWNKFGLNVSSDCDYNLILKEPEIKPEFHRLVLSDGSKVNIKLTLEGQPDGSWKVINSEVVK